jgi:hypothetical protein
MNKKPRKVRKDKGVKRGSLKDQRFMKEMAPYFGPFDPKKLEQEQFMKDMEKLFIVHKTTEQAQKEQVDAGIKYNQSLPPNERVMFNMDLLRHINKFVPTPLRDAVAYAKEHIDTDYILRDGSDVNLYKTILQVIISLKNKDDNKFFDVNYELSRDVVEYLQDVCIFIETKNQTEKLMSP